MTIKIIIPVVVLTFLLKMLQTNEEINYPINIFPINFSALQNYGRMLKTKTRFTCVHRQKSTYTYKEKIDCINEMQQKHVS